MRQGWVNIPENNKQELEYILSLLENELKFNIAILYGSFVGGKMRSEKGGYELLLLTPGKPTKEGWELEEYIRRKYANETRIVWKIHIETVSIDTFNQVNTSNWYFWNIRMEGTIIYDSDNTSHRICRRMQFKSAKAYRCARRKYDYFFTLGSNMLDEAECLWNDDKPALAAIQLSYAAQCLIRAEEMAFYGFIIHTPDLQKSFRRARLFSKKLIKEFWLDSECVPPLFEQLTELRNAPCEDIDFILTRKHYRKMLGKLRVLQEIIHESCERHLFYLEHGKTRRQMMEEKAAEMVSATSRDKTIAISMNERYCSIYKQDVKHFLERLQQEAHWMYVLMHHSSNSEISVLYEKEDLVVDRMSIAEFEKQYDKFEQRLPIIIHFNTYHFKDENIHDYEATGEFEIGSTIELECAIVLDIAPYMLANICRNAMESGTPFVIDEPTIAKYGFTPADVELLRDEVAEINNRLMQGYIADYDRLKKIVEQK